MEKVKAHYISILFAVFLGLITPGANFLYAAGGWSLFTSLQFTRGNYTFENSTSTYYFYGGIRYRTPRWNLSATMPVIAQNSDLVTSTGGGFLPSGAHGNEGSSGSHHGGGMDGAEMSSFMTAGLGDLYLYGEYGLLPEQAVLPYVSANLKLKVPTAATGNNFGSGEFDYGLGIVLRKSINTYVGFVDIGYWILGDPPGVNYKDPLTIGAGVGRFFGYGRYALMFYFGSYSNILPEFESNRQISLGFNYRLNPGLIVTIITGAGLSETSPDFLLSGGMEWAL
jgi:hypothetical protein